MDQPIRGRERRKRRAGRQGHGGLSIQLGGVGLLDDGDMAGLEWSVTGRGVLSFDWKVSSEADWDVLRFYEVGTGETNVISGTGAEWTRITRVVEADSPHTFRWEYEKDPHGDYVGDDCGWIDAFTAPFFDLTVNGGTGGGTHQRHNRDRLGGLAPCSLPL